MKWPHHFFLLAGIFLCLSLGAQQPLLINYGVKEGLPSSEVYSVMQDHSGYIWIATDAGVSRYDGYRFHNYSTADGLPDNTIFEIKEDHHGRIWFRSYSGKISWFRNDTFHTIEANPLVVQAKKNAVHISMAIDAGDTIWCGYVCLFKYIRIAPPYGKNDVAVVPYDTSQRFSLAIHKVTNDGFIYSYMPYAGNSVKFFTGDKGDVQYSSDNRPFLTGEFPKCCRLPDGRYFCGILSYGVIAGQGKTETFTLPSDRIFAAQTLAGGTWLGFSTSGVWYYPGGNVQGKGIHYLNGYSVTSVLQDHEGGIWLTTLENGVYYMPPGNILFYNKTTGFPDTKVKSLCLVDDELWAGCANGHVCCITHDSIYDYQPKKPFANMYAVDSAGPGTIFISSSEPGFFSTGKHQFQPLIWPRPLSADICGYTPDKNGNGWGIARGELIRLDRAKATVTQHCLLPTRCTALRVDGDGTLWIAGQNGLWSFENDSFIYHGKENPLLSSRIENISFDAKGRMWMVTRGAGVLIRDGNTVRQISTHDGLASDICRSLFIDGKGFAWIATNNGISSIHEANGKFVVDNYYNGGNIFGEVSWISSDGNVLWAATSQGLVSFPVNGTNENQATLPVYITAINVNGNRYHTTGVNELSYNENFISIAFTGISYKARGRLKYRYRLEGLDTAWHYTNNTEVQFTTLPPGSYNFLIFCIGPDGKSSVKPATWSFRIIPPFWTRWWFITCCAVIVIAAGLVYLRFRLRKERDKQYLERKMTELELAALRAQMNPHFIFNAMNSIQHFILSNDKVSAQKYLTKFSRLMRGILENSRQRSVPISAEIQTLSLYIELEAMRSGFRFDHEIQVAPEIAPERMRIQPMIVQPYVENAILHGLIPLEGRKGKLLVKFEMKDRMLLCTIEDNGIGRAKAKENKERRQQMHASAGMAITARRLEMLNEGIGLSIEDKTNEQHQPSGTRVVLHIPIYD